MEDMASKYGQSLQVYWTSGSVWLTRGGRRSLEVTPQDQKLRRKKVARYEILNKASDWDRFFGGIKEGEMAGHLARTEVKMHKKETS